MSKICFLSKYKIQVHMKNDRRSGSRLLSVSLEDQWWGEVVGVGVGEGRVVQFQAPGVSRPRCSGGRSAPACRPAPPLGWPRCIAAAPAAATPARRTPRRRRRTGPTLQAARPLAPAPGKDPRAIPNAPITIMIESHVREKLSRFSRKQQTWRKWLASFR